MSDSTLLVFHFAVEEQIRKRKELQSEDFMANYQRELYKGFARQGKISVIRSVICKAIEKDFDELKKKRRKEITRIASEAVDSIDGMEKTDKACSLPDIQTLKIMVQSILEAEKELPS
ncbi:MAG: hypothetical protein JAY90_20175 [Candidatus Thiodiazotropha lotti]|nr:hypothetical protein [Candidatus Thiodiazotropha lotti]